MIDRREAVRRISVLVGGALCPSTVAGLMAGCRAPGLGERYEPRTLSRTQLRRVETVAELILPATDTPGASGARVHEYVDMMLSDFFGDAERRHFLGELEHLDEVATSVVGSRFDDASPAERTLVLEALDDEAFPDPAVEPERAAAVRARVAAGEPPFMRTMKELTVTGYYTSEVGQTVELRIPPFGPYLADEPLDRIGRSWA
jgi:hypothetical protein